MKNKKIWLVTAILVGGGIYLYYKNKTKKQVSFVDDSDGGGNRGRGVKVTPLPTDQPRYTTKSKGK